MAVVVSKATIMDYLDTTDPDILNKFSNIIESLFHKAEGVIVKSITDIDGYTVLKFSDDTEQTFAPKAVVDALISGIRPPLYIADTPTEDGSYPPQEEGTYPNAGGLTYLPNTLNAEGGDQGYKVNFIKSGATWTKERFNLNIDLTQIGSDDIDVADQTKLAQMSVVKAEQEDRSEADTTLKNKIDLISLVKYDFNTFFTNNIYVKIDGTEVVSGSWQTSDYIPISEALNSISKLNGHPNIFNISFYTEKNISSLLGAGNIKANATTPLFQTITLTSDLIPEGALYVRFCSEQEASEVQLQLTLEKINKQVTINANNSANFAHFSFDDVRYVLMDLISNEATYTSCFENPFLAKLREFNETYGAKFSLFCYTAHAGFSISNVPTKFATEFKNNSHWLKFGLHINASYPNYSATTAAQALADYNSFTSAVSNFTGTLKAIDRCPRLSNFAGNLESIIAMRNANAGIVGLLSAYDTRDSYYLTTQESEFIFYNGKLIDTINQLTFFTSIKTLETVDETVILPALLTLPKWNVSPYLILMMHEYAIYGDDFILQTAMVDKITYACEFANDYDYKWEFPMNKII